LRLIRFRLLGDGNEFYVSPAHSEILILTKKYLLGRKVTKYKKVGRDVLKRYLCVGSTVGSKNI
jgi:hypothetical protein